MAETKRAEVTAEFATTPSATKRRRAAREDEESLGDVESAIETLTQRSDELVRDVGQLVHAFTEANAEIWSGTLRAVGDFWLDVADAITGARRREREEEAGEREERGRLDDAADLAGDLGGTVTRALDRSARVLKHSFERFSDVYDEEPFAPSEEEIKERVREREKRARGKQKAAREREKLAKEVREKEREVREKERGADSPSTSG